MRTLPAVNEANMRYKKRHTMRAFASNYEHFYAKNLLYHTAVLCTSKDTVEAFERLL